MNSKTISKVHKFGKIGNVVSTVLMIIAAIVALMSATATVIVVTLPKDAVVVSITNNANIQVDENNFAMLWNMISDGFSFASEEAPLEILGENKDKVLPPENEEFNTKLNFFGNQYSSAIITAENSKKIIDAKTEPSQYRLGDFTVVLVFATLLIASVAVLFGMLKKLFKVISECESPFCEEIVNKMRLFGFSLIPVAVFSAVGETVSTAFMSAGLNIDLYIPWGVILAFIVTMCLVVVFKYGVQLQKESDETL